MGQYNVTQAEVLAHEPPETQVLFSGRSVVAIHHVDSSKTTNVKHQSFVHGLCWAMTTSYVSRFFTSKGRSSLDITFYGIAGNTVNTARAFETAYNLAVDWARAQTNIASRNSYCHGLADELYRRAKK